MTRSTRVIGGACIGLAEGSLAGLASRASQRGASALALATIGLGANLGSPRATLEAAVREIGVLERTRVIARSSFYESEPLDASGPLFVNAVLRVATRLPPFRLLKALQDIERRHGRRRPYRNAPRTLDLDLLLYGDLVIDTPRLCLPHPRMAVRAFVLAPLVELDPEAVIGGEGRAVDLLRAVDDQPVTRLAD